MQRLCVCGLSSVQLSATPWTTAHQHALSMEFSRQEHWSGLLFPSPGDLPDPGIKPSALCLLHRQADSLPLAPPGKPTASKCQKKPIYKEAKLLKALTLKALRFHVRSPGLCSLWNQSMETNTKKLTVTSEVPPPPPNIYLL